MRAAAAEIDVHEPADLRLRRRGIFLEQRLRPHDHPRDAEPALRRLLFDERALHVSRSLDGAQAFQCLDSAALQDRNGNDAGENGRAVDHDRAGTALTQAAAEFGAVQLQVIA